MPGLNLGSASLCCTHAAVLRTDFGRHTRFPDNEIHQKKGERIWNAQGEYSSYREGNMLLTFIAELIQGGSQFV